MDAVPPPTLPQQHLPQRLASAPGWSRRRVGAEGPFGGCLPAQTPINLLDYPGMASAACALQSPAALQPRGEFHPNAGETSAWLRHPAPGPGGVGGPLSGTSGVSLMSPAESQLWRIPPSKTSASRDAAQRSPASSHPVTALGGPLWGTPTPAPFPLPRRADAGAGAANSTNHRGQVFPSSLFPILLYPHHCQLEGGTRRGRSPKTPLLGRAPHLRGTSPIQHQHRGMDAGWIQAGLAQDGIDGAPEQAVLRAGDVTKAGMGRSCRARSPWGYFHPRFAFCPALPCTFALAPMVPALCTGPRREPLGLSGSCGDSAGAAAPMGAAGGVVVGGVGTHEQGRTRCW